jgi:hypothetical protein
MFWEGRRESLDLKNAVKREKGGPHLHSILLQHSTTLPPKNTQSLPRSSNCCRPHGTSAALHRPASARSSVQYHPFGTASRPGHGALNSERTHPLARRGKARSRRCRSRPEVSSVGEQGQAAGAGAKLIWLDLRRT